MISWTAITDFGDSAAMLPAAITIGLWLAIGGAWCRALAWMLTFTLGMSVVIISKLAFIGWGYGIRSLDFTGVSGHSMLATAILSCGCYLAGEKLRRGVRLAGAATGMAGGFLIGLSRLELQVHSVSEVVAGCLLGGMVSGVFVILARRWPRSRVPAMAGGGALLLLLVMVHGGKAPTQDWITRVAEMLSGQSTPYTRANRDRAETMHRPLPT
jgi:membrane-associated phospholipid phosphatase